MKSFLNNFLTMKKNILPKNFYSIDYFELLEKIKKQIIQYYNSEGKPMFILGLSGGIDSALVAYLIQYAVGSEKLLTLNLPYFNTDKGIKRARLIASLLGNKHFEIPIKQLVDKNIEILNKYYGKNYKIKRNLLSISEKNRIGNIASRTRVSIIYDFARTYNGRVLGTANKVDLILGYATKWGTPFSFDYGILNDFYKFQIIKFAEILKIPSNIINAKPSTGFYLDQSHEKEIGINLFLLDFLIYYKFEKNLSENEIIKKLGLEKKIFDNIMKMIESNKHKFFHHHEHVKLNFQ